MGDTPIHDSRDMHIINPTDSAKKVTTTTAGAKELLDVNAAFSENPHPGRLVLVFLENGGSSDMVVDGSSTPVDFIGSPPTGKKWFIKSIHIIIEDSNINFSKFGGVGSLTNGVDFFVTEDGQSERALASIKRNGQFYSFANDVEIQSAATDILIARINLGVNAGTTFSLTNSNAEQLKATVNDDLTGLDVFNILMQGFEVDE